ncbi:sensor domain-containing protein [Nocardioides sp. WS12]|uniref:sensor histidine kinase n=1 Tax=Nocardioides sp. WS12 TaxID=2486272 RepID=UPI0015FB8ED2|nr:sensor domain-containing protein [Nocardioides sp. WS12]
MSRWPEHDVDLRAGRWALTGYAALHVLLFAFVIVTFVLVTVSAVLTIVWVGVVLLIGVLPLMRGLVGWHRTMSGRILGAPVTAPYSPLPGGVIANLKTRAADPMTWRDLFWMLWAMTFGFVASLLALVLFLGVITWPVWWYGVGPLMRARACVDRALLTVGRTEHLERRVQVLTESRAVVVDHSAAELRRIERDLHDGPQARLAAVSLSLGLAEDLFESDPEAARRLVLDARSNSSAVLGELRDVVRGIHPPVLADRGLTGAVSALAIDMAVPVELTLAVDTRLPAPVESAVYFTVAECLANATKHASAARTWIRLEHSDDVLRGEVGDDGRGGADPRTGTGLQGIAARLAAFDGTMAVSSPLGGPTVVSWEIPCRPSA